MQRTPRNRLLAVLLTIGAMVPIGGFVSAAFAATNCPNTEGTHCILVISAPESVPAGQVFSVQVAVTTDGTTVAKSDPCASKVLVRLELDGVSGGLPSISSQSVAVSFISSQSVNAKAGIATFNVTVADPGQYQLNATAGVFGDGATVSNCSSYFYRPASANFSAIEVAAGQPIAPCPDNVSCTQATSDTGSAATLFADTGTFDAAFGTFDPAHGCGDAGPADPNGVLTFLYTGTDSKTIIFALRSDRVTKGIGLYKICWRSLHEFTQLGGTDAPLVDRMFTGYLPSCKKDDVGPCVLFKTSGQHHVGFFGILAPPDDPQAYPG